MYRTWGAPPSIWCLWYLSFQWYSMIVRRPCPPRRFPVMFPSWLAAHQELQARVEAFEDSSRLRVSPLSSDSYGGAELHIIIIMKIERARMSEYPASPVSRFWRPHLIWLVVYLPLRQLGWLFPIFPNILIYGKPPINNYLITSPFCSGLAKFRGNLRHPWIQTKVTWTYVG